jgi:hypothetical protein
MTVNSIGSSNLASQAQTAQRVPEAAEVRSAGGDNDGDSDDRGGAQAVQAAPAPSVNLNGQKLGQRINATA